MLSEEVLFRKAALMSESNEKSEEKRLCKYIKVKYILTMVATTVFAVISIIFLTVTFASEPISITYRSVSAEQNNAPIIGVLAQEISYHLNSKFPGEFKSMIAASYVKFIEGGGARVVPIW